MREAAGRDVLYLHFSKLSWTQGPGPSRHGEGPKGKGKLGVVEVGSAGGGALGVGSYLRATLVVGMGWLQTKRNLRVRN